MKKIILMAGLLAMGSMYAAADDIAQKIRKADDIAQKIRKNEFNEDEFDKLPNDFKPAIAKVYYLLSKENLNALPEWLRTHFQGVSVQDLIDYNRVPAFENMVGMLTLYLRDKNLTSLEGLQNIPDIETVQELLLSGNQLSELPEGVFRPLPALRRLELDNNQLTTLPENIFNGLTALQYLWLGKNQLTTLPENIFNGLTALQYLWLDNNQLTTLQPGIFNGLTALEWLFLNGNQLTTLPENIFNGLTALRRLWLDNNKLSTLQPGVFNGLTALRRLWLQNNQLSTLQPGVFNDLTALLWLRLDNNQLSDEQVGAIRTALQERGMELSIGNQRPPVEDESALTGSSTGSEQGNVGNSQQVDESAIAASSTGAELINESSSTGSWLIPGIIGSTALGGYLWWKYHNRDSGQ